MVEGQILGKENQGGEKSSHRRCGAPRQGEGLGQRKKIEKFKRSILRTHNVVFLTSSEVKTKQNQNKTKQNKTHLPQKQLPQRRKEELETMSAERLKPTALLVDMGRDEFAVLTKFLDMKDVARLDTAMTNRRGRSSLLEGIRTECYEGSEGEFYRIKATCLRWLVLRGIGLRCLSVAKDVPSSLAFAVARNSPQLKYLHMNYDDNNNTYMEQLEACCPELEEVKLRYTMPEARFDKNNAHELLVELVHVCHDNYGFFCEKARLHMDNWHRDSSVGRKFSWRRLMYSMALIWAISDKQTDIAKRLIETEECNVAATDILGRTALMFAAENGITELVRLLLQKDTSNIVIDAQHLSPVPPISFDRRYSRTALMTACWYGHADIIELLIRSGASIYFKDEGNKSAFQLLDENNVSLSQEEKTRLKDLPRLIKQEQLQQQQQQNQRKAKA